jgi:hypothetical protein
MALSFLQWAFRLLELDEIVSPLDIGASVPAYE